MVVLGTKEKRRIIQEMDAQERERKQLEKKKHQPIIDTQIARKGIHLFSLH